MRSALSQFLPGDELVVVRDSHGDPEDTSKVCERVTAFGQQVTYLEHDAGRHYHGGTAQSNVGFGAARGDFILSIGDDDALVASVLDAARNALVADRVLIARVFITLNGLLLPTSRHRIKNAINGSGAFIPRQIVQPFKLTGDPSVDYDWVEDAIARSGCEPEWLDACTVIAGASRRNGHLANLGPLPCASCRRMVLAEDLDAGSACIVCRTPAGPLPFIRETDDPLRIVFVWPAAEMSVWDTARGYHRALERAGHTLYDFKLNNRFKYHAAALERVPGGDRSGDIGLLSREASAGIAAFVLDHDPDVVLIMSAMSFHPNSLVYLRKLGVQTVAVFTESPYNDVQQVAFAEAYPEMFCATQDRDSAARYGWLYLPSAFDPAVHRPVPQSPEFACDVFLVGTGWPSRQALLESVDWMGVDFRLFGIWPSVTFGTPLFRHVRWTPEGSLLLNNTHIAHAYASAAINLNIHRSDDIPDDFDQPRDASMSRSQPKGFSVNPRVAEIAACGGFLLTDHRPGLEQMFEGVDVPTFDPSVEGDLERQIRWWLARPAQRREVAAKLHKAIRKTVLTDTFDARVQTLLTALNRPRVAVVA